MSGDMDNVQQKLQELADGQYNPGTLQIIDSLSRELDSARSELLYERMSDAQDVTDKEVTEFKRKVYASLKTERAADLAMLYGRKFFEAHTPAVCLAVAQALVTIANEQKAKTPKLWQDLLESRGHI